MVILKGKKVLVFCFFSFFYITLMAQENCSNGIDDDGDGLIDCYDNDCADSNACANFFLSKPTSPLSCREYPEYDSTVTMQELWKVESYGSAGLTALSAGDIDNDGIIEVLYLGTSQVEILNGIDGHIEKTLSLPFLNSSVLYHGCAFADIDNDRIAEIFAVSLNLQFTPLIKLQLTCLNQDSTIRWTTETGIPHTNEYFLSAPHPFLTNFNADDSVEVCFGNKIFSAHTGALLLTVDDAFPNNKLSAEPIVADLVPDDSCTSCSGPELIISNQMYAIDLDNDTFEILNRPPIPSQYSHFTGGYSSVADINQDGLLDVVIISSNRGSGPATSTDSTYLYTWDPRKNTIINSIIIPNNGIGGRVNIGNYDNDPEPEISYAGAYYYVSLNHDLTEKWRKSIIETSSSITGSTVFDFNCDGTLEILYRDEQFLYIIDSAGKVMDSVACESGTAMEYPIVVDVNNDGNANILCGCSEEVEDSGGHLMALESASQPWANARNIWNQFSYFGVNINDDLSVPRVQQNQAHPSLSELNGFLNQPTLFDELGNPLCFKEIGDLEVFIDSISYDCDSAEVLFSVCHGQYGPTLENIIFSVYKEEGTSKILTDTIYGTIDTSECISHIVKVPVGEKGYHLVLNINDTGSTNIDSIANYFSECSYDNNMDTSWMINTLPIVDILNNDTTVKGGSKVDIFTDLNDVSSFYWEPQTYLNNPSLENPSANADSSIVYYLIGESPLGCKAVDSLMIKVINKYIAVPTAFTPNGDGINDQFEIHHAGIVGNPDLLIYNRWGVQVFATTTLSSNWDGSYEGELQENGLYNYLLKAQFFDGEEFMQQGELFLIR